ncbi:MAG: carbonic anhydrase [Acidobacteria bacterium]|nr:carbonic anhydrase [Acidobacteriota bacterium]
MKIAAGCVLVLTGCLGVVSLGFAETGSSVSADEALGRLTAGNARFSSDSMSHGDQSAVRRHELEKGQKPYAIVLGCSDSRVSPEIIFDEGLGDLFVVRVAGNTADAAGIGSIEYAVEHLGVRLIIVLGHERCGAVDAAVKGGEAPGHIGTLIHALRPALRVGKLQTGDAVENVVRANAQLTRDHLRHAGPILRKMAESGELKILAAKYHLGTGQVEILP